MTASPEEESGSLSDRQVEIQMRPQEERLEIGRLSD